MMKKIARNTLKALLILLLASCADRPAQTQQRLPQLSIKVAPVTVDSLCRTMQFSCKTHSLYDMDLEPRTSGYLQSIHYQQGGRVQKGQLLVSIEPSGYNAELAEAQANLAAAQAQKVKAQNTLNRYQPLWNKRAISKSSLDEAIAALAQAKASLNSAKAQLYNAELNVGYTRFHAPFDGVIGQTNATLGQLVGPGTEYQVINTVSNIDSIYVYLPIPLEIYIEMAMQDPERQRLYNDSRMVSNVRMQIAENTQYPHPGHYKFTQREVDATNSSVVLHILFPNPQGVLRPNQFVRVTADLGAPQPVMLVPQKAVMQQQGTASVYVVNQQGDIEYRKVELGQTYGSNWEIKQGLKAGELVLTEGLQKVRNGQKIKPIIPRTFEIKDNRIASK